MTDYPTIRIKCGPKLGFLALLAGNNGLTLRPGDSFVDKSSVATFHVKRTKTGVTVRQIEGGRYE